MIYYTYYIYQIHVDYIHINILYVYWKVVVFFKKERNKNDNDHINNNINSNTLLWIITVNDDHYNYVFHNYNNIDTQNIDNTQIMVVMVKRMYNSIEGFLND